MTLLSPEEKQKRLQAAVEYINAAPDRQTRQLRKQEMHGALYSSQLGNQLFVALKGTYKKQSSEPLDKGSDT